MKFANLIPPPVSEMTGFACCVAVLPVGMGAPRRPRPLQFVAARTGTPGQNFSMRVVAGRIRRAALNGETRSAAAGGRRLLIVDLEHLAHQPIDKVDF